MQERHVGNSAVSASQLTAVGAEGDELGVAVRAGSGNGNSVGPRCRSVAGRTWRASARVGQLEARRSRRRGPRWDSPPARSGRGRAACPPRREGLRPPPGGTARPPDDARTRRWRHGERRRHHGGDRQPAEPPAPPSPVDHGAGERLLDGGELPGVPVPPQLELSLRGPGPQEVVGPAFLLPQVGGLLELVRGGGRPPRPGPASAPGAARRGGVTRGSPRSGLRPGEVSRTLFRAHRALRRS